MTRHLSVFLLITLASAGCGPQDLASDTEVDSASAVAGTDADFANLSTRLFVGTGDEVAITGFVISGSGLKRVVIRALGPTLTQYGIADALADPVLELYDATGALIALNDNWRSNAAAVRATGLAPPSPFESAIVVSLGAGAYTAIVRGVRGGTGVALVEVYDKDPGVSARRLTNVSTRGNVLTGDQVMIGGFVVQGTQSMTVLVRGIGPSLTPFGIQGALANPTINLIDSGGQVLAVNDDWGTAPNRQAIIATGFAPSNAAESAVLVTLAPGAYTVIVSGVGGSTGIGLIELYDVTPVRFAGCEFHAAGSGQSCLYSKPQLWQYVGCQSVDGGATCSASGEAPYPVVSTPPPFDASCPASPYLVIAPNGYCACPAGTREIRATQTGFYDGTIDCLR